MGIAPDDFRKALGGFASGVTVVTALNGDGTPVGVTVSAFSSVSLDPPLVLFCLDKGTTALTAFQETGKFVINILADDQKPLSDRFAAVQDDRFSGVDVETWETGAPVLKGAVASLECHLKASHDGGDHMIFIGHVTRSVCDSGKTPLVYAKGAYARLA